MPHPLHTTRVRFRAARHGGTTAIYNQTTLKEHYNNYTLLKDVLRHPRQKDIGQALKLHHGPFLNNALDRIIYLQTFEKDACSIFELMELQDDLTDSEVTSRWKSRPAISRVISSL